MTVFQLTGSRLVSPTAVEPSAEISSTQVKVSMGSGGRGSNIVDVPLRRQ